MLTFHILQKVKIGKKKHASPVHLNLDLHFAHALDPVVVIFLEMKKKSSYSRIVLVKKTKSRLHKGVSPIILHSKADFYNCPVLKICIYSAASPLGKKQLFRVSNRL